MPELPEVETVVRRFKTDLIGANITSFQSFWANQVKPSVEQLQRAVAGKTITDLSRRAKYIIVGLEDASAILIHLKMSGRLSWYHKTSDRQHVRAQFRFADKRKLDFYDTRKFGRIIYTQDPTQTLAHLGPEPLEDSFRAKEFQTRLARHKRKLKPLLLDQTFLAGLGNIYCDESLFRAGLHPLRSSRDLSWNEVKRLHRSIRQVLREAIARCGTSFDWVYPGGKMQRHLRVYGRFGQACFCCKQPIQVIRVGQRSTHFCAACQPEQRHLESERVTE